MSAQPIPFARGGDHTAYLIGERLLVRLAEDRGSASAAEAVEREVRVLKAVAELSPLRVPRVAFALPAEGCLAYELLPGVPLIEVEPASRASAAASVAERLGRFLTALHTAPAERMAALIDEDEYPMEAWAEEAREHYARARAAIPPSHHGPVEAFLDAPPPPPDGELVFSHNDLGIEHVLVDPRSLEVTGVIDWSDAALVDPARDFGLLLRDLGPAALDSALAAYSPRDEAALRARAGFYARAALLEDLVFGLEEARAEYSDKSIAGLTWLFPCASAR